MDLLDLPLFFLLALIVGWSLTRSALRPVRELTQAARVMAGQHSPTPIEVPPGDDELSEMARSFNMMQLSVQTLLERERAFTRYASHELRTPLSTFKVQLEALELGLSPVEQVLPVLERNALRMEGVLTALLALALSGERNPEHTALKPLLRAFFGTLAPEARARLKRRGDLGDHVRVADAHLIVQVMHNLIENPLRYSEGDVIFCAEVRGRALFFSVRDFGPGVPEDTLKGLTRPFYRRGGHRESLGLGLALVESISRSLSGTLELRNANPGLEARFTVPLDPTS